MKPTTFNLLGLLIAATAAGVGSARATELLPDQVYVQVGLARQAQTLTVGAGWAWDWRRPWGSGVLTGHWEASFGRWVSDMDDGPDNKAWVAQLGATPVLRWKAPERQWYLEAGIGGNLLLPIYRRSDKRFSTAFNFGSHLAIGLLGGEQLNHDPSLRLQHYSNAGICRPKPGEDFLQLRYTRRL